MSPCHKCGISFGPTYQQRAAIRRNPEQVVYCGARCAQRAAADRQAQRRADGTTRCGPCGKPSPVSPCHECERWERIFNEKFAKPDYYTELPHPFERRGGAIRGGLPMTTIRKSTAYELSLANQDSC